MARIFRIPKYFWEYRRFSFLSISEGVGVVVTAGLKFRSSAPNITFGGATRCSRGFVYEAFCGVLHWEGNSLSCGNCKEGWWLRDELSFPSVLDKQKGGLSSLSLFDCATDSNLNFVKGGEGAWLTYRLKFFCKMPQLGSVPSKQMQLKHIADRGLGANKTLAVEQFMRYFRKK